MAKKSNHKTVVFLQDYAGKKAGEEWSCDGMLASSLVTRGIVQYRTSLADNAPLILDVEKVSEPVVNEVEEPLQQQLTETKESIEPESATPVVQENNSVEKVSEPESKQKSSSKSKNKK